MPRIDIVLPLLAILVLTAAVTFISYARPTGPWVTAIYFRGQNAFLTALPYVDSVAADNPAWHTVTVYAPRPQQRDHLKKTGAFLIDPHGVPTCMTLSLR